MENETKNQAEDQDPAAKLMPNGLGPTHPVSMAIMNLAACVAPYDENAGIGEISDSMEATLRSENLGDPDAAETMLAAQARVLDALFNRHMHHGIEKDGIWGTHVEQALKAQRQCRQAVESVKKFTLAEKKLQNATTRLNELVSRNRNKDL